MAKTPAQPKRRKPIQPADGPRTKGRLMVMATKLGIYPHQRRRPGEVFEIADKSFFSDKWMKWVAPGAESEVRTTEPRAAVPLKDADVLGDD